MPIVLLKIRVYLIALLMIFFSTGSACVELKSSVGIGIQYGGLIGWQGSARSGDNSLRFAIGVYGLSAGYDRFFNDRYSIGLQGFILPLVGGVGVNMNYYFSGAGAAGWMLGFDLSRSSSFNEKQRNVALLSFGYRF